MKDELSKVDIDKLEQSSLEILENLNYLEKKALTAEQQKMLNKTKRLFYKANKYNKTAFDKVNEVEKRVVAAYA